MFKRILLLPFKPFIIAGKAWWKFLDDVGVESSSSYRSSEYRAPTTRIGKAWDRFTVMLMYAPCYFVTTLVKGDVPLRRIFNREDFGYYKRYKKRMGFTLIEMAIVIVIIGLLLGGVMAGRDLIKAAELRATISQKEKFDAAANAFKLKYNCLPGDCKNASQFGLGSGTTLPPLLSGNGNGDSVICNPRSGWDPAECINFWHHLLNAELIDERPASLADSTTPFCNYSGYNTPKAPIVRQVHVTITCAGGDGQSKAIGGWGIIDAQAIPIISLGRTSLNFNPMPDLGRSYILDSNMSYAYNGGNILTSNDMRMVDQKIDDGLPLTGRVFAIYADMRLGFAAPDGGVDWPTFSKPASSSWDSGYPLSDSVVAANLVIRAGF